MPIPVQNTRGAAADKVLYGVLGLFVVVLAVLVTAVFIKPDAPEYAPSPILPRAVEGRVASDTITVDAGDGEQWQFFDFHRRSVVTIPDTTGWDLAFRRFNVIVAGGVRDLGVTDFHAIDSAPTADYVPNTFGRDTTNAEIGRWYTYGMVSHMLQPKPNVFVVRNTDGSYAKLQFLSYYCPGLLAGCVTFHYTFRADGAGRFD